MTLSMRTEGLRCPRSSTLHLVQHLVLALFRPRLLSTWSINSIGYLDPELICQLLLSCLSIVSSFLTIGVRLGTGSTRPLALGTMSVKEQRDQDQKALAKNVSTVNSRLDQSNHRCLQNQSSTGRAVAEKAHDNDCHD